MALFVDILVTGTPRGKGAIPKGGVIQPPVFTNNERQSEKTGGNSEAFGMEHAV